LFFCPNFFSVIAYYQYDALIDAVYGAARSEQNIATAKRAEFQRQTKAFQDSCGFNLSKTNASQFVKKTEVSRFRLDTSSRPVTMEKKKLLL
jgi:hypothetical protein